MQGQTSSQTEVSSAAQPALSAYQILQMNHAQLVTQFRALEAPSIEELKGEYRLGELSQQSTLQKLVVMSFNLKSSSLCKAFEALGSDQGRGYNAVVTGRGVERKMFFETHLRPSKIDGKPSLHIHYETYNADDRVLSSIVDELRKVKDGLYLGLGYAGESGHRRVLWPFMLEGPAAPFDQTVFA